MYHQTFYLPANLHCVTTKKFNIDPLCRILMECKAKYSQGTTYSVKKEISHSQGYKLGLLQGAFNLFARAIQRLISHGRETNLFASYSNVQ
jgi:hypothetical protein